MVAEGAGAALTGCSRGGGVGCFALTVGAGVSSGSGVGDFLCFGGRFAGFGLCAGEGVSVGVGEGTVRISSRAFKNSCRFSSSVSSAWTEVPMIPASKNKTPK